MRVGGWGRGRRVDSGGRVGDGGRWRRSWRLLDNHHSGGRDMVMVVRGRVVMVVVVCKVTMMGHVSSGTSMHCLMMLGPSSCL